MATKFMRVVDGVEAPAGQAVMDVSIDGLASGGSTPAAGSITNEMLAGGITAGKLASGVLPGAATASKAGLVKQAAVVANVETSGDLAGIGDAYNNLLESLRDAGIMARP